MSPGACERRQGRGQRHRSPGAAAGRAGAQAAEGPSEVWFLSEEGPGPTPCQSCRGATEAACTDGGTVPGTWC